MALTADTSGRLQKGLLVRDGYFITVRNSSCGKVMFFHLSVSHSVHGVGVYTYGADTPLPRRQPLQRTVHILPECILVVIQCILKLFILRPGFLLNGSDLSWQWPSMEGSTVMRWIFYSLDNVNETLSDLFLLLLLLSVFLCLLPPLTLLLSLRSRHL